MKYVVDYDDCIIYEYNFMSHDNSWEVFYSYDEAKNSLIIYWEDAVHKSKLNLKKVKKLTPNTK